MLICWESGISGLFLTWAFCCIQLLVFSMTIARMVRKYSKRNQVIVNFQKCWEQQFCLTPSVLPQTDAHLPYLWFQSKSSSFSSADDGS
jgi:hypothetical protein